MINPIKLLLDLPAELQVQIYEISFSGYLSDDLSPYGRRTPTLLRVNRQLRLEGQQIFYSKKIWEIPIRSFGKIRAGIYRRSFNALRALDESNELWHVQNIRLDYDLEDPTLFRDVPWPMAVYESSQGEASEMKVFCDLLSRLPSLRKVVIRWNDDLDVKWEKKRRTFLAPLAALPKARSIMIIGPDTAGCECYGCTKSVFLEAAISQSIQSIMGTEPHLETLNIEVCR